MISYQCIGQNSLEKLKQKETVRTTKTGHGSKNCTVRHYSNSFMLFLHREVLRAKRTAMVRGSWLTGSDRTVRFKFENLHPGPRLGLSYLGHCVILPIEKEP